MVSNLVNLVPGVSVVNEKPVWAGVKSQGVSEIRMRGQLGSEVSTDVDLGVLRRLGRESARASL